MKMFFGCLAGLSFLGIVGIMGGIENETIALHIGIMSAAAILPIFIITASMAGAFAPRYRGRAKWH